MLILAKKRQILKFHIDKPSKSYYNSIKINRFCSINLTTFQEVTYMESDHAALITLRFLKIYATLPDLADNSLTRTSTDIVKEIYRYDRNRRTI